MKLSVILIVIFSSIIFVCVNMEDEPEIELESVTFQSPFKAQSWLEKSVEPQIRNTVKYLERLSKKPSKEANNHMQEFRDLLQSRAQEFTESIDRKQKEATKLDIDIAECTAASLSDLQVLSEQLANSPKVRTCVQNKVDKSADAITSRIKPVKDKLTDVQDLVMEIQECREKGIIKRTFCKTSLMIRISNKFGKVHDELANHIAAAKRLFENFNSNLASCTQEVVRSFEVKGHNIVSDVISCISSRYPKLGTQMTYVSRNKRRKRIKINFATPTHSYPLLNIIALMFVYLVYIL